MKKKHVHLIGIGGTGLSAIGRLLIEKGFSVSGSDRTMSSLGRDLIALGAEVFEGHKAENIGEADVVVRSSAIPDQNPEVQEALARGIPVYKRIDFLGDLMADQVSFAVAGTHGKTTTTAMAAWVLSHLNEDPSYIIGGVSKNLGSNAHAGKGKFFVIEADEYDRMFLGLNPDVIVLTNVEHDHPDCFPTRQDYIQAFNDFVNRLKPDGKLFVCAEDEGALKLAGKLNQKQAVFTYAAAQRADYKAENVRINDLGGFSFDVICALPGEDKLVSVDLKVPGIHNVNNALGVLAAVHQFGLDVNAAAIALGMFEGTGRRFDVRGEVQGVTVVDDYAHHPVEIKATLAAARSRFAGREIWAVWQPHTYSRTQMLMDEFACAFGDADHVLVTEVYAAREHNDHFSSRQVVSQMDHSDALYVKSLDEVRDYLLAQVGRGDVVLVLSAGDADRISAEMVAQLNTGEIVLQEGER